MYQMQFYQTQNQVGLENKIEENLYGANLCNAIFQMNGILKNMALILR